MSRHNDLRTIHHWSLGYALLRPLVDLFFRNYYKKIEIINKSFVQYDVPVILAPNHQNALMDALAILNALKGQPVFLARADIFSNKVIAKILHFLNIMPVYRIRDGMESLALNDEIFQATLVVLRDRHTLCMMPEGSHSNKRRLRPLVKGIFRIAFMAQKEFNDKPWVKIIPVGIDYSDYEKFQHTVFLNFGKSIEVSEFYKQWETNPAVGMNLLRDRLADEISKLMIDIRTVDHYDTYMALRTTYNSRMKERMGLSRGSLASSFDADKEMIRCMDAFSAEKPDELQRLSTKVKEYSSGVKEQNLRDWVFRKNRYSVIGILVSWLLQILCLPFFIYGLLNNAIPYFIPARFVRKIKDRQFHSSVKMVTGMLLYIIWYLLLIILAFIFFPLWIAILYIISIPPAGFLAFRYFIWVRKVIAKWRYSVKVNQDAPEILELQKLRSEILILMDGIMDNYQNKS